MTTYLAAFSLFLLGIFFMAGMLHFSRWRQKSVGCCYDVLTEADGDGDRCNTCPLRDDDEGQAA